jgi:hypothetical protein
MLLVKVEIASGSVRKTLAEARIANISDLADISDYAVYVREGENPIAKSPAWDSEFPIEDHDRRQTVWALVAKVATAAADEAKAKGGGGGAT